MESLNEGFMRVIRWQNCNGTYWLDTKQQSRWFESRVSANDRHLRSIMRWMNDTKIRFTIWVWPFRTSKWYHTGCDINVAPAIPAVYIISFWFLTIAFNVRKLEFSFRVLIKVPSVAASYGNYPEKSRYLISTLI